MMIKGVALQIRCTLYKDNKGYSIMLMCVGELNKDRIMREHCIWWTGYQKIAFVYFNVWNAYEM